jgi:hypothetical protein
MDLYVQAPVGFRGNPAGGSKGYFSACTPKLQSACAPKLQEKLTPFEAAIGIQIVPPPPSAVLDRESGQL